ncbi:hypothetical protein Srufu_080340 (plasmid) [Streptomyces libani subsp. rufus]|nr:hypothetical protein Srufu_080340 [Streptomyces libani subsp. rufus]
MTVTYLPVIAGMAHVAFPGFDREQWTTCYVERLDVGDVFSTVGESFRPMVLVEACVEAIPGEVHGWFSGVARYVGTGELACFKVRANVSAVVRCDMHYRVQR